MYQCYLDGTLLPVTPEALQLKIGNQNETYNLINEGEINVLKKPGLTEITFGALLPNVRYPFAQYPQGFAGAESYLGKLETLKTSQKPFDFQVIRTNSGGTVAAFDTSFTVSLEEYTIHEEADSYGRDVYVDITLKQYQAYVTKTITFQKEEDGTKAEVDQDRDTSTKKPETTYTVKAGDCMWNIAKAKLGDGTKWKTIYELNKELIDSTAKKYGNASSMGGTLIYPGMVLKLPAT